MAEKRSIPGILWKHKKLTAVGLAGLTGWVVWHASQSPEAVPAEPSPAAPAHETGGQWANTDPHSKRLACALLLKKAGVSYYYLQTYVTEGTPAPGATVTYTAKFQGGLFHGFAEHHTDPASLPWQQDALIPGVDQQELPLASVRGSIGDTACAPAVAQG